MTVNRQRRVLVAVALTLALPGCGLWARKVAPPDGGEVRDYLGSSARRQAPPEVVSDSPQVTWRSTPGRGSAAPVAVGERITAVATLDRRVLALDTRTGKLLWQWRGASTFAAGPVMGDGMLFVASEGRSGTLTALALASGRRRWYHRVGDVGSPITLRHGRVYGATTAGSAVAYEAASGRRVWLYRVAPTRSGPAVIGEHVVIVTTDDSISVLEAATGRLVSRRGLPSTSIAPLTIVDDSTVAFTSPTGAVVAFAVPSGEVRWQVTTGNPVLGAAVASRDTIFALTNNCVLWTIPVATPEAARSQPLGCFTKAAPAVVRDGVLVATVNGILALHSRSDGRLRWADTLRSEIRHPPMVLNGQFVVGQTYGDVVSYR